MADSRRPYRERLFCEVPRFDVVIRCDLILRASGELAARANLNCSNADSCLERYGSLTTLAACHLNRLARKVD